MVDTTGTNIGADRRRRLNSARLYVLTDGARDLEEFTQRIVALVASGVDIIQLREKHLSDALVGDRIERAAEIIRAARSPTLLILNDRVELARKRAIDGVHVGQDDAAATSTRALLGRDKLIGVSTHNIEQARLAIAAGADYLGAGPTFPSKTKSFEDFPGLGFLSEVSLVALPVFAIGGINDENLDRVMSTGITRVAVSSAIIAAADVHRAVRRFQDRLKKVSR